MKFYALRKPARPVLYTLLLILISTATLVFSLQTLLDGLLLDNARAEYAYVVTPFAADTRDPLFQPVEPAVVERLSAAPQVDGFQHQDVRAGKLRDHFTVPDNTMTMSALTQHYFLEGTITNVFTRQESGLVQFCNYVFRIDKNWSGQQFLRPTIAITCQYLAEETDTMPKPGDRVFLICNPVIDTETNAIITDGAELKTGAVWEHYSGSASLLQQNNLLILPAAQQVTEDTLAESEGIIREWMAETGILPLYETASQLENPVTVRLVSDMSLIPNLAEGRMYLDSGRQLYESDRGQKVCMVSQSLMLRNRFIIGDKVALSVAEDSYVITQGPTGIGWESGQPMENEDLLDYGDWEEYEIVGVFAERGRDIYDPLYCGRNDIFIPVEQTPVADQACRAYNLSFRVPGDDYDAFIAENEQWLLDRGYLLQTVDNGWEDVADSFYAMADRRVLTLICAALCFVAAALSFGGLIFHHYTHEYGLCRLLGAYRKEARRVYWGGFVLSALPGALAAILCAWLVYVTWLRQAVFEAAPLVMPTDGECLSLLALWTAALLAAAAVFLRALIGRAERRGVLRML